MWTAPLETPIWALRFKKKHCTAQTHGPLYCGIAAVEPLGFQARVEFPCLMNRQRGPPMPESLKGDQLCTLCQYTTMHFFKPNSGHRHTPKPGTFSPLADFVVNHDTCPPPY